MTRLDQAFEEFSAGTSFPSAHRRAFKAGWDALKKASYEEAYTPPPTRTLRDEFAMAATEADITAYREPIRGGEFRLIVSYKYTRTEARYRFADDMLEARK